MSRRSPAAVEVTSLGQLADVLDWWPEALAAHLPAPDLLRWSLCSRSTYCLAQRPLSLEHTEAVWDGEDDGCAEVWQALPLSSTARAVLLTFDWRDQGWGNRKGTLAVLSGDGVLDQDFTPWPLEAVAWAHPAEHHWCRGRLVFRPASGAAGVAKHTLWVRAGGGGGHRLFVKILEARELVTDVTASPPCCASSTPQRHPQPPPPTHDGRDDEVPGEMEAAPTFQAERSHSQRAANRTGQCCCS
eukprot:EG_transcript_12869